MIYEPAEDSFLLEKWVRKCVKAGMIVLDMGCGSCIQSKAARELGAKVIASDINPEAVKVAKKLGFDAVESDLFSNIQGKFDLIIFNPPYLPDEGLEDEESKQVTTGGKMGYETVIRFLSKVKRFTKKEGKILFVISNITNPKVVEEFLKKKRVSFRVLEKKKMFSEELLVYEVSLGGCAR